MAERIRAEGETAQRFGRLRGVREELRGGRGRRGLAVTVDGELVVDLWGGHRDAARTKPWLRDTLVNVYSTTKEMTAICANRLAEQGKLDLDAPVAQYWPEFAQAGKAESRCAGCSRTRPGWPRFARRSPPAPATTGSR